MNQTAKQVEPYADKVPALILTLTDRKLLVPITAVAEVVSSVVEVDNKNSGSSFYGWIYWRDQKIPLLSYEVAAGASTVPPLGLVNRIAILNAIGDAAPLGFYAILLQDLPTPVQIGADTFVGKSGRTPKLVLVEAQVAGEEVTVPDLAALETLAAKGI